MTTTEEQVVHGRRQDDRTLEVWAGGSMAKAIGGAAAVVLSILGLANVIPRITVPIATMAVGVALLFEGGAIAARYARAVPRDESYLSRGMTAEFFGGATGIVLGLIALIGVAPILLCAVATIVFGASVLFGAGVPARLASIAMFGQELSTGSDLAREGTQIASGSNVMVGMGSVVLGILVLIGTQPASVLVLVALLSLGIAVLLSGTAVSTRIMSVFQH